MKEPKWDIEETKGFVKLKAWDGLEYKVWNTGTQQEKQKCADILAKVRLDMNTLLIYLMKNPQLWIHKKIAWGIFHTFDIHIANWDKLADYITTTKDSYDVISQKINKTNPFVYQEISPNDIGLLGINKPKKIITIQADINGKIQPYEIAERRLIMLTLRTDGKINDYLKILKLALHELTHTTCNDVRWKEDNHMYPYNKYLNEMTNWAKEAGVFNF
jgi:hypothetical protein